MMNLKALVLGFALSLFSITALADGDHGHGHSPVDQATAEAMASKIIASFVKQKTIDNSWSVIPATSVDKKTFNEKQEWVVSFVNEKMPDLDKRKLYIFLTLSGDYIAANYTGK